MTKVTKGQYIGRDKNERKPQKKSRRGTGLLWWETRKTRVAGLVKQRREVGAGQRVLEREEIIRTEKKFWKGKSPEGKVGRNIIRNQRLVG